MNKKENIKNYYIEKYKKNLLIKKYEEKTKNDVMDKIINNLRLRAYPYAKNIKLTTLQLIGCSKENLKNHLKNKFIDDMSFDNYGKWEIDHIKPLTAYDLNNNDEILKCFSYKNLQPLWKSDNCKKYNKYINVSEAN
jgi:hypothetical protein